MFLARLLEQAGHETRYLACDAALSSCYNLLLKKSSSTVTCATCRAGGVRSFQARHVTSLNSRDRRPLGAEASFDIAKSSVVSLHRLESKAEMNEASIRADLEGLKVPMEIVYGSALRWFEREKLDALLLFNGRMDATRAVLDAAKSVGLPVLTIERPWFGHGAQLVVGEMCLDLEDQHRIVREYDSRPLTLAQATQAARQIVARYGVGTMPDWRVFHASSRDAAWPGGGRKMKVLILPSSRGEVHYNPSWEFPYAAEISDAYDGIMETLGVEPADVVVRAHPIWAQMVGRYDGHSPRAYYESYTRRRGIHWIPPEAPVKTLSLIEQADVVVTVGGATAVEAAGLGKPVISVGPAVYSAASAFHEVFSPADLAGVARIFDMTPEDRVRSCLRAVYSIESRVPQYVNYMRSTSSTHYEYFSGADPERMIRLFRGHPLECDDPSFASEASGEDEIVERILQRQWDFGPSLFTPPGEAVDVSRRWMWAWLDSARALLPPGDRL